MEVEPESNRKPVVAAVVCAVLAVAAVAFAVQRGMAYETARRDAAKASRELGTASANIATLRAELEKLNKEAIEQKMAAEQARAELAHAQSFVEAEKATGKRLREELAKVKEDLAKKETPKPPVKVPIRPGLSAETKGAPAQR